MSIYKLVTTRATFSMPKGTILDKIDIPKDYLICKYMRAAAGVYNDLNIALVEEKTDTIVAEYYTRKGWSSYTIKVNIKTMR